MNHPISGQDVLQWAWDNLATAWGAVAAIVTTGSGAIAWILKLSSRVDRLSERLDDLKEDTQRIDGKVDRLIDKLI